MKISFIKRFHVGIFIIFFIHFCSNAEDKENKKVNIEVQWEKISQAKSYELSFEHEKGESPPILFQTDDIRFNGDLPPGKYRFKIRAIDKDGNKGQWSESISLLAQSKEVNLISPEYDEIIEAKQKWTEVKFVWDEFTDAKGYVFRYWNDKDKNEKVFKLKSTSTVIKLLPGRKYFWDVIPVHNTGARYERNSAPFQFTVYGKKIPDPELKLISELDPIKVLWKPLAKVKYQIELEKRELLSEEWNLIKKDAVEVGEWKFPQPLIPGEYNIRVKGEGDLRIESSWSSLVFFKKPTNDEIEKQIIESMKDTKL